jgi:ABC-type Fe3+-siderophore transport system permease subunit
MRRAFRDMNPTVRGFLVIALIAVVIVVLQLESTLTALFLIAQIAFFLAIAFFIYLVWRERREEISMWSTRSRVVFYGSALLMVVNAAARFFVPVGNGWKLITFVSVFVLAGFAMWRVWRDEHTYGY